MPFTCKTFGNVAMRYFVRLFRAKQHRMSVDYDHVPKMHNLPCVITDEGTLANGLTQAMDKKSCSELV